MHMSTGLFGDKAHWGGKKTCGSPFPSGRAHLHFCTRTQSTQSTTHCGCKCSSTLAAEQVQELRRPNYSRDPQRRQIYSEPTPQKLGKSITNFFAAVKPKAKKSSFFPSSDIYSFLGNYVIMNLDPLQM